MPIRQKWLVTLGTGESNRMIYIVLPSFQPSPETTIALGGDDTNIDFTGDLQVDYCSTDKTLYQIYYATEDEED